MSIGTLMAYTLVATSVMVLRYRLDTSADPVIDTSAENFAIKDFFAPRYSTPTDLSAQAVSYSTSFIGNEWKCRSSFLKPHSAIFSILFSICSKFESMEGMLVFGVLIIVFSIFIWRQPESEAVLNFKVLLSLYQDDHFQVPLIPFIPVVNILVNVYLMVFLRWTIWVKLTFWLAGNWKEKSRKLFLFKPDMQSTSATDGSTLLRIQTTRSMAFPTENLTSKWYAYS